MACQNWDYVQLALLEEGRGTGSLLGLDFLHFVGTHILLASRGIILTHLLIGFPKLFCFWHLEMVTHTRRGYGGVQNNNIASETLLFVTS